MTGHPSALDRLEARIDTQAARIDELDRRLRAAASVQTIAVARRRPPRGRDGVSALRDR